MLNYDNKRPYNGIDPKDGEQLVPVLAYDLLAWDKECIEGGLSKPGQLLKRENLETWHYGGRKILVGFVAVPNEQVPAALEAFRMARNQYLEETRKKRCLIMNNNAELIECPKHKKCDKCEKALSWKFERITSKILSLDEQEENMNNPNKKGYAFSASNNVDEAKMLALTLDDLINDIRTQNEECGSILELVYEGYLKSEILNITDYSKGKSQGYNHISKVLNEAKTILENKGYSLSDFIK